MAESQDLHLRHLARVVDSSDDAIISKDLDGFITSWNAAAERIFGHTAEEAIGRNIRMIIPADRQAEEDDVLRRIRAGDSVSHFETIRCRKDGALVPISLTVSPIRDDQKRIIGASKIARDISETVRLLDLARTQMSITERLHDVGAIVASELDRDTIAQKVTDLATELTGAEFGAFFYNIVDDQRRESYLFHTLSGAPAEAFGDFPHPRVTPLFEPTFRGEGPVRIDDVTTDPRYGRNPPFCGMPDGHLPVRSYLAVPVSGRNGAVLGGLFFGHSSPEMFSSEDEQLALGVAAWATVALENARLYVEAREASRMKDEFLAVLSHELRTPLSAITGYARLLRSGLLAGDRAARGLEALDRSAAALTHIIEDVLDVSRIISGKLRLDVQPVHLPLIVEDAVATVQPAAEAKGVRVHTIVDTGLAPVSGDKDRLRQVAWNLLSNAVKFTPRGGRVQVRLERINSHVELSVADTGVGIAREFLPHVFERFTQSDRGPTRKYGGLGLGLAIVRHIVELHGGTAEAMSEGVGQGATFVVRLPVMIVHPKPSSSSRQHPGSETRERLQVLGDLGGIRILAVDDEDDALALLRDVLEMAGAAVVTESSANAVLGRLRQEAPDVLLIDIGMPEMDGYALIQRIRSEGDTVVRSIPAAALTAFARAEDRTRALEEGFEMHLAKPVDPAELVAAVKTLVRRAHR